MSIQNVPLMRAMASKMIYLDKRQGVIAQNMANADTPGYRPQDLTKVDFGKVLEKVTNTSRVSIQTTNPAHMPHADAVERAKGKSDRMTYEVAPAGNAVIMEEQMIKANQTQMDYNLMAGLLQKQSTMYRLALGRQQ
jgi:flagellar basal-body rod protein FlgB